MAMDRRQELIEAAFALIAEKGFEGLRLRDVSGRVGIDHSTLHHYFATKNDLVAAVVSYATGHFRFTLATDGDPAARLAAHIDQVGALITSWPELARVLREVDLRAGRDPAVHEIMAAQHDGWRTGLIALLRAGAEAGSVAAALSPEAGADLIIATLKGATLRPEYAKDVHDQLVRLLVQQI
jgi:AcrR family transcriptional regulator